MSFQSQREYKRWVSYLLNRKNKYTNILYKDEPTILAWDLMNEPQLSHGFDASRGLPTGSTMRAWVNLMIKHIRVKEQAKQLVWVGDVRVPCCITKHVHTATICTDWGGH